MQLARFAPWCALALLSFAATVIAADVDRSPVDLVLAADETWLVTINQTADTASLVRTSDGKVLHELAIGDHPTGIALLPDGNEILIACHHSGQLQRLQVAGELLKLLKSIERFRISIVYTMLYWLIMTPLGGPVVPEV